MSDYLELKQLVFNNCISTSSTAKQLDELLGFKTEYNEVMKSLIDLQEQLEQIANATIDTPNVVAEDFMAIAQEALAKYQRIKESDDET